MKWLFFILFIYIFILFLLYFYQDKIIFNSSFIVETPLLCEECKDIELNVEKNVRLVGKERYPHAPKLLLYFGGNADDATRIFNYLNPSPLVHVLTFNYRGYQRSGGKPSQKVLFEDALKIYDEFAKSREVIVMGRSLGTGVALYLASKREVKDLILITPYDSIREIAKTKYPIFPVHYLIKHPFNSISYAPFVEANVSVIEVLGDKVVPNKNTSELLKNIENIVLHLKLENISHGNVLEAIDFDALFFKIFKK